MTLTTQGKKAYRELIDLQDEYGSPCIDKPNEFAGDVLPSTGEAMKLCAKCPITVFNACGWYARTAHPRYGVYAGVPFDDHGDVEVGWDEEVEMVLALGAEDTELVEGSEQ